MVDALISFALESLTRFAADEAKLVSGTKGEVDKLSLTLRVIQASLQDAEMRQFQERAVKEWLSSLQDVAYEVDDALDEWNVKFEQLSSNNAGSRSSVWNFFTQCTCFQHLILHHDVGKKIQKINQKLDQIANQKNFFNFHQNRKGVEMGDSRITSSCVDTAELFGREGAKEEIKHMLISEDDSESSNIAIIAVVGMGGYGKTTLAQFVFNDDEVKHHFDKLIWVCVSDEFDVAKIVKKIIEAIEKKHPNAKELEALQTLLWDNLANKRFLLVLDDVWNEDYEKWERLNNILKNCGTKRSKIVVTTRLENVAHLMRSKVYPLGQLSDEDCWSIFKKVADMDENEYPGLVEIGREIVVKCKGTPLAIKTLAATLSSTRTKKDWENVLKTEIWDLPDKVGGILPALLLSYYHLSPQLKRCFRYCSIFPKDYNIKKKDLVRMWEAQGYIPHHENKEMGDTGEEYFVELLRRSLLQEPQRDNFGNITKCKMHDLVHDLAQFVSNGECTYIDGSKDNSMFNSRKLRHCTCTWDDQGFDKKNSTAFKNLRTLTLYNGAYNSLVSIGPLERLQCTRVLILDGITNLNFLKSIGKLVHLRYLQLSCRNIEKLPESVGKLWNLRYLNLEYTELKEIPKSIGKLGQLRYLNLKRTKIKELPESITDLRHMRLLNLRYLNLGHTQLKEIPESVVKLGELRYLNLKFTLLKEIPESIGKLGQLRYLKLERTYIKELPESITDLRHMRLLNLNECDRLYKLPGGIQKMTSLKRLEIEETSALKTLPAGIGKLSSLEKLDRFILTEGEGECKLSDLRDLNHLQGSLSIENLEAGSIDEAVNAKLEDKSSLRELELEWSRIGELRPSRAEGVLEALRPHHSLQELLIFQYQGSKFPSWIGESSFSGLVAVALQGGPNCTELPALGNLPQLRNLYIEFMPEVRRVGSEFFGSKNGFPKLESLLIRGMEKWEEWDSSLLTTTTGGGGVGRMPCLRQLWIYNCAKLKALPPIFSEELREVVIYDLKELSGSEWIPPSVEKIKISRCPGEFISKLASLPKLECLNISDVTTELSCDLLRFTGLKTLHIENCSGLKSLPEEFMNSLKGLQELYISGCENLKVLRSIASEALKEVRILKCPNLSEVGSIPPSTEIMCLQTMLLSKLPSLPMLNRLKIEDDYEVMELSNNLITFTELQTLRIWNCPNLRSFPEEMSSLKKLRVLNIICCPNLKESCKRGGEQWSKIAHIPRIKIDGETIQDHA